jgi:hypothetical protein
VDCAREVGFSRPRARQNVIFELGYFVGSLGRARACLLRKGDVEIPSDLYRTYMVFVYTHMDAANGWKIELARELKDGALLEGPMPTSSTEHWPNAREDPPCRPAEGIGAPVRIHVG